jgi:hypothetical protein
VEKCEEADKNKGIASSSTQKCKVYKTFNLIVVVVRHEPIFSPESALMCYECWGEGCGDPYSRNPDHEVRCKFKETHCVKASLNNGKWLHKRHLQFYTGSSHQISHKV